MRFLLPLTLLAAAAAPVEAAPAWSPAVEGVRARLVATPTTDAAKKPQLEASSRDQLLSL